jgi:hypothetical protein
MPPHGIQLCCSCSSSGGPLLQLCCSCRVCLHSSMRAMLGRRRLAVLAALLALLALLAALHTPQRLPTYDRTSHFAERGVKGADFFFVYTRRSACPYTIAPHISLRGGLRALNFRPRRRRRFCERQRSPSRVVKRLCERVVKRLCERPRCHNTTLTRVL